MTVAQKLQHLYPTPESILSIRLNYKSWKSMAKSIGVPKDALRLHRKALGMEMESGRRKPERKYADYLTMPEINANIRKMFKSENVVTMYKITDMAAFEQNVCGDEGLVLVGKELGNTWDQVHNPGIRR